MKRHRLLTILALICMVVQQQVKAFVLNFGNGETTSLREISNEKLVINNYDYYTLDGRKLSGKPTAKGIYIWNGKKRVIK